LSSVRIAKIDVEIPRIEVMGADLMDGTPIYDIKPYLPGVDAHPEATDGFVGAHPQTLLTVELDPSLTAALSAGQQAALREILAQDPRPAYHAGQPDSGRIYGLSYAGRDIHFTVCDGCIKAW
ncbi:MAG: SAM-dependent methyltransferase, partial [Bacteroidales bacterium]|nr:SAM-dependent methyltransferase [Bacteroidales bacterium]